MHAHNNSKFFIGHSNWLSDSEIVVPILIYVQSTELADNAYKPKHADK